MKSNPQLTIQKFIKGKRSRIFEAWLKPELAVQWFSPENLTPLSFQTDAKTGGHYIHVMKMTDRTNITTIGKYIEIIENEKIVFTWGKDGITPPESIVTILLQDQDDGTLLTLSHEKLPEDLVPGHVLGWESALRHLDKFFKGVNL